jgi:predicted O-methyltransferase YrrM
MGNRRFQKLLSDLATAEPDEDERAAFEACEAGREARLRDRRTIGDVFESSGGTAQIPVAEEASRASVSPAKGRLLYRLVRRAAPGKVVELGSALGVSGSYIASGLRAAGEGTLVTIEGSASRQAIARETIEAAAPGVAQYVQGLFDDNLDQIEDAGMVFVDGNHEPEPLRRYVDAARDRGARPCVLVLDDIEDWSESLNETWRGLVRSRDFAQAGQAASLGVLVLGDAPRLVSRRRFLRF